MPGLACCIPNQIPSQNQSVGAIWAPGLACWIPIPFPYQKHWFGIIENMSGFECPNCKECTNIFSKGGGKALADHVKVPFLAEIPIDPSLAMAAEKGENFMKEFQGSSTAAAFSSVIEKIQKI